MNDQTERQLVLPNNFIKYALLRKSDGEPVTMSHQDDMETELTGSTLQELVKTCAEWSGVDELYFLEQMAPGGEHEDCIIVRQTVMEERLDDKEHAELSDIMREFKEERDTLEGFSEWQVAQDEGYKRIVESMEATNQDD